ncbi:MAG TPA: response regulator transcription factor [Anaerolineae bacterium]|nr:response regulator transcription factor [Anaerolineae bacterium]
MRRTTINGRDRLDRLAPTKSILLVDPSPHSRADLTQKLRHANYQVTALDNIDEAVRRLRASPFDLILADVAAPPHSGFQLYRTVRAEPRLALIPFILLNDNATPADRRYSKMIGVEEMLSKSVPVEDLLAIVHGRLLTATLIQDIVASRLQAAGVQAQLAVQLGDQMLEVNFSQHRFWLAGQELRLPPLETFLLEHLVQRPNCVLNVRDLFQATHGRQGDKEEAGNAIRPIIRNLRRKLGVDHFKNVRGLGYMLVACPVLVEESE